MMLIRSNIIPLHGSAMSNQGGRPENQDDWGFTDTPLGFLCVVCDGMGGGPGGKMASYIVKCEIAKTLQGFDAAMPRDRALKIAIGRANDALSAKMKEVPALEGMGSTVVAVLIDRRSAVIAWAGDSRCYLMHGKKMKYRSADHSLVGELVRRKALTEEEARTSPQSNVITRGLGSPSNNVPETAEVSFGKGDRFILCTDGVWGMMPHGDLLQRFGADTETRTLVENISSEIDCMGTAKGGYYDNHTIAIVEMDTKSKRHIGWGVSRQIVLGGGIGLILLAAGTYGVVRMLQGRKAEVRYENVTPPAFPQSSDAGRQEQKGFDTGVCSTKLSGKKAYDSEEDMEEKTDSIPQSDEEQNRYGGETEETDNHKQVQGDADAQKNLTIRAICVLDSACAVKNKDTKAGQKQLDGLRQKFINRLDSILDLPHDVAYKSKVEAVRKKSGGMTWYIDIEKDGKGFHHPTKSTKSNILNLKGILETTITEPSAH